MKYAQIVVFRKLGEFDNELTYKVPDSLVSVLHVGSFVEVPFRSFSLKGVVVEISDILSETLDISKIKEISSVINNILLHPKHIETARFIAGFYHTSMSRSVRLFLPRQIWNGKLDVPTATYYRISELDVILRGDKQKLIFDMIHRSGGVISQSDLKSADGYSSASLKSLLKKGVIEEFNELFFKKFEPKKNILKEPYKVLTSDQKSALNSIFSSKKPILLHGVTGSGKTEIYLRQILDTVKKGKQVILLVPEIALTPQMINYFKEFFGDHIALFHSKLTESARTKEWWKVKSGNAPLVIGSRSAIFAPVTNLGLIIMDEEHEWTYKQESTPYYLTHRVAEEMKRIWDATLILGSATPMAESYQKARVGEYQYLDLKERIHRNDMPKIHIIDLREEFKKKNFSIFSQLLQNKIKERLENKEQIILFVNQRGMANAVVCRDCGYTSKCPNCDISLKLHRYYGYETKNSKLETCLPVGKARNSKEILNSKFEIRNKSEIRNQKSEMLVCHYCGFTKEPELICPECRSPYIKHVGVGTQRVEQEMKRMFPSARTVRADKDTTQKGDGFASIYKDFLEHKYDVLIGTQMIAKGLDFSNVSLIGIILADIGLHIPDFRSSERLFQILTQVSGRCGRGEIAGEVILQTYNPEHPTIQKAASYEYEEFIENELKMRSQLGYPPFNRMIKFTVVGVDKNKLSEHIKIEQEILEDIFKVNDLSVKIVSAPSMVPKMANRYYYHVLLRAENPSMVFKYWKPPRGWRVDVDPVHTT